MKRILLNAIMIVAACAMFSCKSSKPDTGLITNTSELTGKYWKLVELRGKPVVYPKGAPNEAYITFKADGSVSGNLGCNSFSGNYTMQQGSRIAFSNLINTLKMCMDMSIEDELTQVLKTADSYRVVDNQLILNRARMAPLAKFEVVYM